MQIRIGDVTLSVKQLHFFHFVQCAIQIEAINKNGAKCVLHSNIYWKESNEKTDYLPLTTEYKEPSYSFKKFTNFKRDKTCEREILISRFIDRFIRLELANMKGKEFFVSVQTVLFHGDFDMCQIASLCAIVNLRYLFPIKIACFSKNKKIFIFSPENISSFSLDGISNLEEIKDTFLEAQEEFKEFFEKLSLIESEYAIEGNSTKKQLKRSDRKADQLRPIEITDVSENSMIFSRGLTSVMCFIDLIFGFEKFVWGERVHKKEHILSQYFFPHFATSEGKRKTLTRREIGHSEVVKSAFDNIVNQEIILRIVSETLSADGSSSMAAVCAASATLFKMNLIKEPIAGISMGSLDGKKVITDLSANEDHNSLMDCKIVGDGTQVYTIQMDCKEKISFDLFIQAIDQSSKTIKKICKLISQQVKKEKNYLFTQIDTNRIGYVIGKNGANKKNICYHVPSKMVISENGKVIIFSKDTELVDKLLQFYGRKPIMKAEIAFFALEDFNGQTIKTSIGTVNLTKKFSGEKNNIIVATIKDAETLTLIVKEILPQSKRNF